MIARAGAALDTGEHHPLLLTAAFALDTLCIHPFADGNGRVARLITSHLLGRTGDGVGLHVSLEQLILEEKDGYYAGLRASTRGWFDDGWHHLCPWRLATYLIDRLGTSYDRLRPEWTPAPPSPSSSQSLRTWQ